ncbi:MAG TPA: TetR/AcrR family transcriptional regulator [Thermoanaerobaculia bacterium]|nr:TetR/AcrR family transcriptional regulator [Thermoanaerobaculia bacterium]
MGKGAETRDRIVEQALRLASRDGLEGLTIGSLSSELGLSKSGLFAHFGSKDELQLQVLKAAVERFEEAVVQPALATPRGEPRLRSFFARWLAWMDDPAKPGGCLFIAATVELDDRPGPQRDFLVESQERRLAFLTRAVRIGIEAGHFSADLDPEQLAFEIDAIALGYHQSRRLLRDPKAALRAHNAFDRLINASR